MQICHNIATEFQPILEYIEFNYIWDILTDLYVCVPRVDNFMDQCHGQKLFQS